VKLAGLAAARAAGKVLPRGKADRRVLLTVEKEQAIRRSKREGKPIAEIARIVGLARPTVHAALAKQRPLQAWRGNVLRPLFPPLGCCHAPAQCHGFRPAQPIPLARHLLVSTNVPCRSARPGCSESDGPGEMNN